MSVYEQFPHFVRPPGAPYINIYIAYDDVAIFDGYRFVYCLNKNSLSNHALSAIFVTHEAGIQPGSEL